MKKFCIFAVFALAAIIMNGFSVDVASGRPQYRAQFQKHYKESKIAEAAKEAKCNVCHYGKKKKDRNDYGVALSKHLSKEIFTKLKRDKEALNKKVDEALEAVEKVEKSAGTTFGSLIEEGELPGTAPEE
jgi:cytochrome c553